MLVVRVSVPSDGSWQTLAIAGTLENIRARLQAVRNRPCRQTPWDTDCRPGILGDSKLESKLDTCLSVVYMLRPRVTSFTRMDYY